MIKLPGIIKYQEGKSSWVEWIKRRPLKNQNLIANAEGPPGIGKSWAMISLAYKIDPSFENRQIAFSFKEVMDIINSDWFKAKEWKILILDEAQISISNRQWQSLTNRLMNYLMSTFRHQNIIFLMTSPYTDFLDNQTMKLMHVVFKVQSHNEKTKITLIRPQILQWSSPQKKFYRHSLMVIKDGKGNKLFTLKLKKPPKHLIERYEKDKVAFTQKLNKEISKDLDTMEGKSDEIDTRKPLTAKQQQIKDLYDELGNEKAVAEKLGISQSNVAAKIQLIRKKGYKVNMWGNKE